NGFWKYKFIPDVSFLPVNYKPEFDVNSWDTVQVPGIISQSSSNLKAAGNSSSVNSIQEMTALYSTTFTVPDNWEERQTFVIFEGAGSSFSFWVNGQMAGYSKNNFSPAEFNISSFLKKGVNVLTVRLYLNSHDEFKTLVGGRLGNVYLYSKPNISINNYTVSTDLNQKYKDATIKLSVEIKKLIDRRFKHLSLEASLYDADKHKMFSVNSSELNFIKNGFLKIDLAHNLKNPEKWNAETPYLYTLILTLKDKSGSVIESVAGRVGVRKVEIGNGSLWVNGRRVIIRGINKMEGHSFDKSVMEEEIRRMKQFNMNALRIVGPCTQDLCDLCDEYGIYLCPETGLEATTFNGKTLNDSVWTVSSLDRVKGMVETCRNHPSVISWWLNDKQDHIYSHQNIINWLHQNDPGRPFADLTAVVNSNTDILAPVSPGLEKYLSLRKENKPVIIPYYSGPLFSYLADCDQKQDTSRFDQGGFASEKIGRGFIFKDSIGKAQGNASGFVDENSGIQSDLFVYKHIIQPVKITAFNLKDNKIKIQNCFEAADLSGLKGFWELKDGGTVIQQGELPKLDLPAGMGKVVDIPFTAPAIKPGHEYWLNLYFQLGHNTKFAFQGHEVAWQQFRMPYDSPLSLFTWDKKDKSLDLFENSETYQVTGKDFAVTFGKELGTITSFQFKGKELFKNGPVMDFDDSWENNSTGISKFQKLGLHHLKTVVDKITAVREKTGYVEIRVDKKVYSDSVNYMLDNTVTYGVFPQGDIIVNQNISFQGAYLSSKDLLLSDLGVKMDVPSEFEQCKWFGRGSVADSSNYRNNITKVDAYSSYPMKRDDLKNEGIKSDVRWLTLTDKGGLGFAILGQPVFDAFAIKYPAHTGKN
ncbi:MAG: glycoside hydrolase family 2 TIM barrel-domain containing protein, partial [Bacteroidota bacterium]|nr:glycoside hydrolase family 2 TIM barrel-domain containing protein [Bacteroidota bacterium]